MCSRRTRTHTGHLPVPCRAVSTLQCAAMCRFREDKALARRGARSWRSGRSCTTGRSSQRDCADDFNRSARVPHWRRAEGIWRRRQVIIIMLCYVLVLYCTAFYCIVCSAQISILYLIRIYSYFRSPRLLYSISSVSC